MLSRLNISKLILIAVFLITASVINLSAGDTTKVRYIPGINGPDQFPKGCVSCHKNYTDVKYDARLSTLLTAWYEAVDPKIIAKLQPSAPEGVTYKGKHPFKVTAEANIPEVCNKCHGKIKNAPPLNQLLHVIHLTGDKNNHFMTAFNGECTHCHKLDPQKGTWTIVNGKETE